MADLDPQEIRDPLHDSQVDPEAAEAPRAESSSPSDQAPIDEDSQNSPKKPALSLLHRRLSRSSVTSPEPPVTDTSTTNPLFTSSPTVAVRPNPAEADISSSDSLFTLSPTIYVPPTSPSEGTTYEDSNQTLLPTVYGGSGFTLSPNYYQASPRSEFGPLPLTSQASPPPLLTRVKENPKNLYNPAADRVPRAYAKLSPETLNKDRKRTTTPWKSPKFPDLTCGYRSVVPESFYEQEKTRIKGGKLGNPQEETKKQPGEDSRKISLTDQEEEEASEEQEDTSRGRERTSTAAGQLSKEQAESVKEQEETSIERLTATEANEEERFSQEQEKEDTSTPDEEGAEEYSEIPIALDIEAEEEEEEKEDTSIADEEGAEEYGEILIALVIEAEEEGEPFEEGKEKSPGEDKDKEDSEEGEGDESPEKEVEEDSAEKEDDEESPEEEQGKEEKFSDDEEDEQSPEEENNEDPPEKKHDQEPPRKENDRESPGEEEHEDSPNNENERESQKKDDDESSDRKEEESPKEDYEKRFLEEEEGEGFAREERACEDKDATSTAQQEDTKKQTEIYIAQENLLEYQYTASEALKIMAGNTKVPQPGPAKLGKNSDLDQWLECAKKCQYLPEAIMKKLCEMVKELLMEESNVQPVSTPVTICGDIHGQFYDLLELFRVGGGMPDDTQIDAPTVATRIITSDDIEPPTEITDPKLKRKLKKSMSSSSSGDSSNVSSEVSDDDDDEEGRGRPRGIEAELGMKKGNQGGLPGNQNYIFLGDFVDRGYFSLETFTLLMCLKAKFPDRITLVRGNHESRQITQVYGFYEECQQKYGNASVWKACCQVFDFLILAAVIDGKVLCVHGGLSPEIRTLDQVRVVARAQEIPHEGAFCDLVWSDPEDVETWAVSPRGAGWLFGDKVASEFNHVNGLQLIARAHQLVNEGFKWHFRDKSVVTVWSAPNYCYRCGNVASIMNLGEDLNPKFTIFSAVPDDQRAVPGATGRRADYFL